MKKLTYEELARAFDRQSLQLQQTEQKLKIVERQCSELESVVIKARNALTPRGMVRLSCEQESTITAVGINGDIRELPTHETVQAEKT